MIFVLIVGLIFSHRFSMNTFISEIYSSPEGTFEYLGVEYKKTDGYVFGLKSDAEYPEFWNYIGKTNDWENIYVPVTSENKQHIPDMIYIDGEKPDLYVSEKIKIPVSGIKTSVFTYTDSEDHSHYKCSNFEEDIMLAEKVTLTKGRMKKYETENILKTGLFFSFGYDGCAAGADSAEKYFICCMDDGGYVYVPDYKNNLIFNDDGSAEFYGILIEESEIIEKLDTYSMFANA